MVNKDTKYTIEVELKGDSKQVQQAIKDGLSKDFSAKIGADNSKLIRDMNNALKEINSSNKKVKIGVDGEFLLRDINKHITAINNDGSLKKLKLGVDKDFLLRDINKAITSINSGDSIKKLKLGVDVNYLQQQLKNALRSLDTTIKLKTKLETTSKTTDTKGTVTTNKTSKKEADEYQSLFSKRAASIQNLDKVYQEFGKGSQELRKAFKEFYDISKEVRKFGRETGVQSLNQIAKDLERQIGANLSNGFLKNALVKEYEKVNRDKEQLDRTLHPDKYARLDAKARVKQLEAEHADVDAEIKQKKQELVKAIADATKSYTGLKAEKADNAATNKQITDYVNKGFAEHEAWLKQDLSNAQLLEQATANRQKMEHEIAKLKYQQLQAEHADDDATRKQQLLYKKELNAKIAELAKDEVTHQKSVNTALTENLRKSKELEKTEKERLKTEQALALAQSKSSLHSFVQSAKGDKRLDSDKMQKFMDELQNYRNLTGNYRSSFFYDIGRELGITNNHPYFNAMRTLYQSNLKEEAKWRQKPLTANVDVKGSEKVEELNQKVLTTTQQFMRLRGEALKAGNALNKATDPKEVARLTEEFKRALQALVNYQRATKGLTKGGESQLIEKLAIGGIKENTRAYDVLFNWVKNSVQQQRTFDIGVGRRNPPTAKDTNFMDWLKNIDWGRATAGMAYAARGELNTVQAFGNLISSMSKLSGVVGNMASMLGGLFVAGLAVTGILNSLASAFTTITNLLAQLGQTIYQVLQPGIELYKLQETAQLSLAAQISNRATEEGKDISYERGLQLAEPLINRAFIDAVKSAFDPAGIINALQGTLGLALGKGFNLNQAYDVVKGVAAVAKSIQLPSNQILQEARDILQGTLMSRSSQVAFNVGMTSEELKKAEEQGRLYDYIMEKMAKYNIALERYADTFSGAMDRFTETWALASRDVFAMIAPGINGLLDAFIESFIGSVDKNGKFVPADYALEIGNALDDILLQLARDVDFLIEFIKDVTGEQDAITAIRDLIIGAINATTFAVAFAVEAFDLLISAGKKLYNGITYLANACRIANEPIMGLAEAIKSLYNGDFEGVKRGMRRTMWFDTNIEEELQRGILSDTYVFGKNGKFLENYLKGQEKQALRNAQASGKPVDLEKVWGKKSEEDSRKLADLRKAMQAAIEDIKQALKEALAKLKDIAEQNELAYRQGYKSIEDYFSQKAQLEYAEAQLKVAALQREIEEVQKLDTGGDAGAQYQKERDLVRLNGELVIQQRESVKKEEQQTELLQHIYNHLANQTYKQGITAGTQISSGRSVASLSQIPEGVYYDVADADIEGLTDLTLQKLNAVAYEYFKEFGERIVVTSAKRYGDGSSWHDSGQAFDIAMDSLYDESRRLWLKGIAEKYALIPLDEYPGGEGEMYAHGDNFHFSDHGDPLEEVVETVEQESEKAQNMLHGRMPQAFSTLAEAFERAVEEGQNQMIAAQKQYASYMNKPYLYETISSAEVSVKYRKQIDTARARFGEMMPAIANYLELAFPVEQLKVESKALEQFVDNRLKMIEDDSLAMNKRLREKTMLFPQAIDTYLSYFSEKINDWAITDLLDKMAQKADELAKLGAVSEARDITKKIIEVRSKFISMIQSWIEEMNNYFNYRRELINADSGLTSFVKEERIKQLDKGEARVKAVAYAQEAVKLDELQIKYQEQLTKVIEGRNDELDKTMQTDTKLLEMSIAQLETEKQRALRQAEINALLGEQKTLWQETMDAANQALENGLYNFMTDYINTAESIGEAFRNMAIDILKDLQKFFAKKAITDLMHVITGTPNEQYNAPNTAEVETAINTQSMISWLSNIYYAIQGKQALNKDINATDAVSSSTTTLGVRGKGEEVGIAQIGQNTSQMVANQTQTNGLLTQLEATENIDLAEQQVDNITDQEHDIQDSVTQQQQLMNQEQINMTEQRREHEDKRHNMQTESNNVVGNNSVGMGGNVSPFTTGVTNGAGNTGLTNSNFLSNFMNSPIFGGLLDFVNSIFGSALGQIAGLGLAIDSIMSGDKKEQLLGTIFIELQLIYQTLVQILTNISMMGTMFYNNGMGYATGGYISGPGTSTSDSIHAMLSNGEYVIKADAVRKYGLNFLDAVNSGHFTRMKTVIPRFADGGYVGDALQDTARGMTDFAKNLGTSVGVDNTISIALVRDEQEAIREWAKSPSGGQKFLVDFAKGNGRVFSRFNR